MWENRREGGRLGGKSIDDTNARVHWPSNFLAMGIERQILLSLLPFLLLSLPPFFMRTMDSDSDDDSDYVPPPAKDNGKAHAVCSTAIAGTVNRRLGRLGL